MYCLQFANWLRFVKEGLIPVTMYVEGRELPDWHENWGRELLISNAKV